MGYFTNSGKSTREQLQKWHVQTQAGEPIAFDADLSVYDKSLGFVHPQAAFSVSTGIPGLASQPLPSALAWARQWPGWVTTKGWGKPNLIFFSKELLKLAESHLLGG